MPHHQIGHRFELADGDIIWTQKCMDQWTAVKCPPHCGESPEIIECEDEETANQVVADWLEADVLEMI